SRGQRAHYVFEQPRDSSSEDIFFTLFCVISLYHANAAERFGQTPGDLGVDLPALTKYRPNRLKRFLQSHGEKEQEAERKRGHQRTDSEQNEQRNAGSQQATHEINQPSPDQVAHAFHVAHNARDQDSAFGRIVERHWQSADVGLNFLPEFGDQALRRLGEQLSQRE